MGLYKRRNLYLHLFTVPALVLVTLYLYYPIFDTLFMSLLDIKNFNRGAAPFVGLANYIHLLTKDATFWGAFRNTAMMTAATILIQLPIAFLLANFLVNHVRKASIRLEIWLLLILFIPTLLPTPVYAKTWQHFFSHEVGPDGTPAGAFERIVVSLGMAQTVINLLGTKTISLLGEVKTAFWIVLGVQTWARIGFNLLLYRTAILSIRSEVYESAEMDGAGPWTQLFRITVPLSWDIIGATVTLAILGVFQLFDIIWLMTEGGPLGSTHLLATYMYTRSFMDLRAGYGAAIGMMILLSALALSLIQRRLMQSRSQMIGM